MPLRASVTPPHRCCDGVGAGPGQLDSVRITSHCVHITVITHHVTIITHHITSLITVFTSSLITSHHSSQSNQSSLITHHITLTRHQNRHIMSQPLNILLTHRTARVLIRRVWVLIRILDDRNRLVFGKSLCLWVGKRMPRTNHCTRKRRRFHHIEGLWNSEGRRKTTLVEANEHGTGEPIEPTAERAYVGGENRRNHVDATVHEIAEGKRKRWSHTQKCCDRVRNGPTAS